MLKHFILFFDIFFPSRCVCCGEMISLDDHSICDGCRTEIIQLHGACPKCSGEIIDMVCSICGNRYTYFVRNISVFEYCATIKRMIYALKFQNKKKVAHVLGELLLEHLQDIMEFIDIITYVPMTRRRQKKRGYNQSALLARYIAKKSKLSCAKLLRDTNAALSQKEMNYRERFLNVITRFAPVGSASIEGKNVLLVDDVFTTGATINECAKVLKKMGANYVFSLTVARVRINRITM